MDSFYGAVGRGKIHSGKVTALASVSAVVLVEIVPGIVVERLQHSTTKNLSKLKPVGEARLFLSAQMLNLIEHS